VYGATRGEARVGSRDAEGDGDGDGPAPPRPRRAGAGAPSLEEALRLAASADFKERLSGLAGLEVHAGDGRAVKAAVKALGDPDWGVVLRAAGTLAKIGDEESRDPLIRLSVEGEI